MFFNKKCFFLLFLILCFANIASATTFYASPTGDPTADGITTPTSLENAVSLAQNGDIIKLFTGIFTINQTLILEQGITIEGSTGRPYSTIKCQSSTCFKVNVLDTTPLILSRLFFTQTNTDPNMPDVVISLVTGDLQLSRVTFQQVEIAIWDEYSRQDAQLSLYKCRFHKIQQEGIRLQSGAFLKSVSLSHFFGSPSNTNTELRAISYDGSNNSFAQQNRYETEIRQNLFKTFHNAETVILLRNMRDVSHVLFENNSLQNITSENLENQSAIKAFYPSTIDLSDLKITGNRFDVVHGAAINLAQTDNVLVVIDSNRIRYVNTGILISSLAGSPNEPIQITNNLIDDYRVHPAAFATPGRGIYFSDLSGSQTARIYANVAYNTVVSSGQEDDTRNFGEFVGAAISFNRSDLHVLVANNILVLDGLCQDRCAGLHIEEPMLPIPSPLNIVSYGSNTSYGFTINGSDSNFFFHRNVSPIPLDMQGNDNFMPPFIDMANKNFDLTTTFLGDASLYLLPTDIEGEQRGQTPDRGAYQH